MAYTTIDNPELYFQTKLYTGNGGTQSITLDGSENMQPDFVWTKLRSTGTYPHVLTDSVRGATKNLYANLTDGEDASSNYLTSFDSNGFSVGSYAGVNLNSNTLVAWCWKAGGSSSSNSSGDITSTVSANTTAGFSIVAWSGSGTNDETIGHSLGVAPSFIIHKNRSYGSGAATGHWVAKTKEKISSSSSSSILYLNQTNAYSTNDHGTLIPSSSTLLQVKGGSASPSDFWVNASGSNYIAYCFAEKQGFSKFGSFEGNGNADGPFVYCGFRPAFVMIKDIDNTGNSWLISDNKRNPFNVADDRLFADLNNAENQPGDSGGIDFTAQGFKVKTNDGSTNQSGTRIFMAFAEAPFVNSNGVPCNAR
jgi:hypothetical protein